jgi:hypothetical protein
MPPFRDGGTTRHPANPNKVDLLYAAVMRGEYKPHIICISEETNLILLRQI